MPQQPQSQANQNNGWDVVSVSDSPASPSTTQPTPSPQQSASTPQPKDDQWTVTGISDVPVKGGEQTNDVGNKVIVPAQGESFDDTMKRAVAYGKTVTQDQLNREEKTMPAKAATVLTAAPIIGTAGAAGGAAVNEVAAALPSVIPHTIAGVKAIGVWTNANPIQAYLLFQVLKELVPGAKKTMGIIKGVPEVE
jgi:hypothetical protein